MTDVVASSTKHLKGWKRVSLTREGENRRTGPNKSGDRPIDAERPRSARGWGAVAAPAMGSGNEIDGRKEQESIDKRRE